MEAAWSFRSLHPTPTSQHSLQAQLRMQAPGGGGVDHWGTSVSGRVLRHQQPHALPSELGPEAPVTPQEGRDGGL